MAELEAVNSHQRAQTVLETSPIQILRHVRVERDGQALVLSGRVESFYQKQLAQELVRTVASDCEVINAIRVP